MQLFYNPNLDATTLSFVFEREESKHIVKVLRKQEGDKVFVTNGLGYLFETEIIQGSENKCAVRIVSYTQQPAPAYGLHLAVAPTKMNERYEWFLEKATEIGVASITPIICDHSERTQIKTDRYDKVILSAMKQALHYHKPVLNEPLKFKDFLQQTPTGTLCIAHCADNDKRLLKSVLQPQTNTTILIGPEGDFSAKEITMALEKGYLPVSLGETRLRTETAALVACHSFVFFNE